jgi:hypothetical protein
MSSRNEDYLRGLKGRDPQEFADAAEVFVSYKQAAENPTARAAMAMGGAGTVMGAAANPHDRVGGAIRGGAVGDLGGAVAQKLHEKLGSGITKCSKCRMMHKGACGDSAKTAMMGAAVKAVRPTSKIPDAAATAYDTKRNLHALTKTASDSWRVHPKTPTTIIYDSKTKNQYISYGDDPLKKLVAANFARSPDSRPGTSHSGQVLQDIEGNKEVKGVIPDFARRDRRGLSVVGGIIGAWPGLSTKSLPATLIGGAAGAASGYIGGHLLGKSRENKVREAVGIPARGVFTDPMSGPEGRQKAISSIEAIYNKRQEKVKNRSNQLNKWVSKDDPDWAAKDSPAVETTKTAFVRGAVQGLRGFAARNPAAVAGAAGGAAGAGGAALMRSGAGSAIRANRPMVARHQSAPGATGSRALRDMRQAVKLASLRSMLRPTFAGDSVVATSGGESSAKVASLTKLARDLASMAKSASPYGSVPQFDTKERAPDTLPEVGLTDSIKEDAKEMWGTLRKKYRDYKAMRADIVGAKPVPKTPELPVKIEPPTDILKEGSIKEVIRKALPNVQEATVGGLGALLLGGSTYLASRPRKDLGGKSSAEDDLERIVAARKADDRDRGFSGQVTTHTLDFAKNLETEFRKRPIASGLLGAAIGAGLGIKGARILGAGR